MKKQLATLVLIASSLLSAAPCNKTICVTGDAPDNIRYEYQHMNAWGIETILDLSDCDPELIRSASAIEEYVMQLCELIDMNRYGETIVVHFGQDEAVAGYSMVQLIETSLISGHFANATNNVYINIFSCKPYDPYQAAEFTQAFFKGATCTMNVVLRK